MFHILLLDNYDSFTYNLYHQLEKISDATITVIRNDEIDINTVGQYDVMVLSPGPKLPKDAGHMMDIIHQYHSCKPIIGICLGMQGLAEYFGNGLQNLSMPEHGQSKKMNVLIQHPLFENCPSVFNVGRYHSWGIKSDALSSSLIPLSVDDEGWVMSYMHKDYKIVGIQFHPESILTEYGDVVMQNALRYCGFDTKHSSHLWQS
ncbi:MAG: aminodeoxychorismate/anthranilate synthase component II [Bacteroidia bacterium]|nr:MAG: aminodeoxychorismate/anthranilate synthase component II [Bacteroidia bacterium]